MYSVASCNFFLSPYYGRGLNCFTSFFLTDSKSSLANGMSGLSQVQSQVPAQPTPQQQHMYSPHHRQHPAPHTKGFTSYLSNEPPKLNHLPSSTQPSSAGLQQMPHHYIHPTILPSHYNTAA